ncbi:MAG: hypothetical protein HYY84_04680 [Deltaproteobacteria bacterium]|nr:hypothetical protein [Deltaproteobacteria bacterium]
MTLRALSFLLVGFVFSGCKGSDPTPTQTTPSDGGASTDGGRERLYVGTGEYSSTSTTWHAILRFDDAQSINTNDAGVTPSATIPVQQIVDSTGVPLNFAHTLYVAESRNEMYIGALFTTGDGGKTKPDSGMPLDPTDVVGSIGVLANASSANGGQTLARHLFGPATLINQPHGVWVDESRDLLYAANTFSKNILVWTTASTATGNLAPARNITHNKLGNPVFVFVDSATDRLFVACMNTTLDAGTPSRGAIVVYNNASVVNGFTEPSFRIAGDNTGIDRPNNTTTHNVWYDATRKLLIVGHHTFEVLFFDLGGIDMAPTTSTDYNITPRVLQTNESANGSDIYHWSTYGLFYMADKDRLFVANGYNPGGTSTGSGGPQSGSPKNVVRVYDGISDAGLWANAGLWVDAGTTTDAGRAIRISPTRTIYWSSGATYYPPQPMWVTRY